MKEEEIIQPVSKELLKSELTPDRLLEVRIRVITTSMYSRQAKLRI